LVAAVVEICVRHLMVGLDLLEDLAVVAVVEQGLQLAVPH
jgi:hypothetical protein